MNTISQNRDGSTKIYSDALSLSLNPHTLLREHYEYTGTSFIEIFAPVQPNDIAFAPGITLIVILMRHDII